MATSHVGQNSLDRELEFQGVLFLPAVFPDLLEMPLLSENDFQRCPAKVRKQLSN